MKGYVLPPGWEAAVDEPTNLPAWEELVVSAVGTFIEFWGFKRNQGRVWAFLYLRGKPATAAELQAELGLSKGAVSMLTRELEGWGVVHRVRPNRSAAWRFVAETDLLRMTGRVVRQRESTVVARVRADIERAATLARKDRRADPEVVKRVERLASLAALAERTVQIFLSTSRLDAGKLAAVLRIGRTRDG